MFTSHVAAAVEINEKLAAIASVDELYPVLHRRTRLLVVIRGRFGGTLVDIEPT